MASRSGRSSSGRPRSRSDRSTTGRCRPCGATPTDLPSAMRLNRAGPTRSTSPNSHRRFETCRSAGRRRPTQSSTSSGSTRAILPRPRLPRNWLLSPAISSHRRSAYLCQAGLYDKVLKRLCDPKGPMMTPAELGSFAVRQYCAFYFEQNPNPVKPVSLTLIDLQRMDEVRRAVDALAVEIALVLDDPEEQALLELLFLQSQIFPGKPFVDVADLCLNLAWHANSKAVCAAAATLGDILIGRPTLPLVYATTKPPRPAVIEHGRNVYSTARLHGLKLVRAARAESQRNLAGGPALLREAGFCPDDAAEQARARVRGVLEPTHAATGRT